LRFPVALDKSTAGRPVTDTAGDRCHLLCLAAAQRQSDQLVGHHLRQLRNAGLARSHRDGADPAWVGVVATGKAPATHSSTAT
jgi:hypothetical protein